MVVRVHTDIFGIQQAKNAKKTYPRHVITALTGRIIPQLTPAKGIFLLNALRDNPKRLTLTLTTMPAIFSIQHMVIPLAIYIAETI
jgi:hypothetical protein